MSNDQNLKKQFKELISQNVSVVATNPAEMQAASKQIQDHLTAKLDMLGDELKEMHELVRVTESSGMNSVSVKRRVKLVEGRIRYYSKLMSAVHAGYHIIPDFPVELFAVRTDAKTVGNKKGYSRWSSCLAVGAKMLPEGEGRYVSPVTDIEGETETDDNGKEKTIWRSTDFREVEFPVALVKPQVVESTGAAMKLGIFDEIGICRQQSGYPMVIGRLKVPGNPYKYTCFLITWFLEARDL